MDHPSSTLASFDPTNTLGSLLIGGFIAVFLFSLSTVQTYLYYREYPKDRRLFKLMVAFVWICELAHTIGITNLIYVLVITFYGQPEKVVKFPPVLNLLIGFDAPVTAAVQIFYTDRIRRFIGRRIYIPVTLWFLSGIRMAGVYFLVIAAFMVPSETEYVVDWGWMFTLLFIMGAFVDVAIAIALVANLYTHRKHVFSPTQKMLDRLIRWTVQTGLVTSIVAVAVVICFQTMKSNLIWLTIYTCLGEVYSNSFMAILNARNGFQNDDTLYEVSVPAGILFPDASASGDTDQRPQNGIALTSRV